MASQLLEQQSTILAVAARIQAERSARETLNPSALVGALMKLRENSVYDDKKALAVVEAKLDALLKAAEVVFSDENLETFEDMVEEVRKEKQKEANVKLSTVVAKESKGLMKDLGAGIFTDLLGEGVGGAIAKRLGLQNEKRGAEQARNNDIEDFKRSVGTNLVGKEGKGAGSGGMGKEDSIYLELIADQTGTSAQNLQRIYEIISNETGTGDISDSEEHTEPKTSSGTDGNDTSEYIELIADQTGFAAQYLSDIRDNMHESADVEEEERQEKKAVEDKRYELHMERLDNIIKLLQDSSAKLDKIEAKSGEGGGSSMLNTALNAASLLRPGGLVKGAGNVLKGGAKMLGNGAKAVGNAAGKLNAATKLGGAAAKVGLVGAALDVGMGVNDLANGKRQTEMPSGWDAISPMKWGMFAGEKINQGIESLSGGKSLGTMMFNAFNPEAAKSMAPNINQGPAADMASQLIMKEEGVAEKAYKDAHGYSVGVGHFIKENEIKQGYIDLGDEKVPVKGDKGSETVVTKAQAQKLLKMDLPKYTDAASKPLGAAWGKLQPGQQAALISYAYNTGSTQSLVKKGLKDAIEKGDMDTAAQIIANGVATSQGRPMPQLAARRGREAALFASSAQGGGAQPAATPAGVPQQAPSGGAGDTALASNTPKASGGGNAPAQPAMAGSKGSSAPAAVAMNTATAATTAAAVRPAAAPAAAPVVVAQNDGGGGDGGAQPSGSAVADPKSKNDTLQRSFDRDFAYAV